jgi:hypothetical protein
MRTTEAAPERALKTPRMAAVAGILCALIVATVIVLIRQLPADAVTGVPRARRSPAVGPRREASYRLRPSKAMPRCRGPRRTAF